MKKFLIVLLAVLMGIVGLSAVLGFVISMTDSSYDPWKPAKKAKKKIQR